MRLSVNIFVKVDFVVGVKSEQKTCCFNWSYEIRQFVYQKQPLL